MRMQPTVFAGEAAPHSLGGLVQTIVVMLAGKIPHALPFLAHHWSRSAFPILVQMLCVLHPNSSFLCHIIHLLTDKTHLEHTLIKQQCAVGFSLTRVFPAD